MPKRTASCLSVSSSNNTANNNINNNNNHLNNHEEDSVMTDISSVTHPDNVSKLHSFISTNKPGFVLAVGENLSNQLGLGQDINDRKKPQLVKELPENVIKIAAGGMHSACLTEDGIVYTFGCNDEFALGRSNDEEIDKVNLPEKCLDVVAGDSFTAALAETGAVYAWGTFRDGNGVLGLEEKQIAKTPIHFKLKEKIVKITCGADHLVFLTEMGEVFTAGNSEHGQLGRVSKYNSYRGGRRGSDILLAPAMIRIAKKKELGGHRRVEDAWATSYCTFLKVKDTDGVLGFGLNNCHQLGLQDTENRYQPEIIQSMSLVGKLKKVVGGMHHTLFLNTEGQVFAVGSHRYGCLGLGPVDADLSIPTQITELKEFIVDIAANTNVSYAISKAGKVFSWGTNYSKQLGQDTEEDYLVPKLINSKQLDVRDAFTVSIGGQHTLFVVSDEKDEDSDNEP